MLTTVLSARVHGLHDTSHVDSRETEDNLHKRSAPIADALSYFFDFFRRDFVLPEIHPETFIFAVRRYHETADHACCLVDRAQRDICAQKKTCRQPVTTYESTFDRWNLRGEIIDS